MADQDNTLADSMTDGGTGGYDYLDTNLDNAVELQALEGGEYSLRCTDARIGQKSPDRAPYILVYFEAPDYPTSKSITHVVSLPSTKHHDEKQINSNKLRLRQMFDAFGYDFQGDFDQAVSDIKGMEVEALLKIEDDPEYGEQNRIARFVTGA